MRVSNVDDSPHVLVAGTYGRGAFLATLQPLAPAGAAGAALGRR